MYMRKTRASATYIDRLACTWQQAVLIIGVPTVNSTLIFSGSLSDTARTCSDYSGPRGGVAA